MAEDLFGDIPAANAAAAPAPKTGPDMEVALKFLRKLRPGRAVHNLVARKPDTFITLDDGRTIPDIKGITLDARDEEGIRDFIRRHTARGCDLYYSVNEVSPHTGHKKASADTIVRLHGVYIDVDPRKATEGENPAEVFAQERWRLMALAKSLAADLVAPPTYIVDSGSGIQAVWLVDKPVDKTELLEARFRAHCYGAYTLHREAGADSTVYNIDRILRLPGTVNFQSEKKRKQGRQEAPTRLLSWTGERYPTEGLDAVSPYVVPPRSAGGSGGAGAVKCDWPLVEGVVELSDIDEDVRDRLVAWRSADSKNDALWSGRFRDGGAQDETGSGLAFTLIGRLKRSGMFSITEAGMLCRAWGLAGDHPVDARDLERCWSRSFDGIPVVSAEEEFENLAEWSPSEETPWEPGAAATSPSPKDVASDEGAATASKEVAAEETFKRVEIKSQPNKIVETLDSVGKALLRTPPWETPLLGFAGNIVEIHYQQPVLVRRADGGETPTTPIIRPLCKYLLRERISSRCALISTKIVEDKKTGDKKKKEVEEPPTAQLCSHVLARGPASIGGPGVDLPPLAGIIETPTLRPDGSLLDQPGYDPNTRLFLVLSSDAPKSLGVPESPTKADAEAALTWLREDMFAEWPFENPLDRELAVGMFLTALVRRSLGGEAPAIAVCASAQSSGKTSLLDLISRIVWARPLLSARLPKDEDEMAKTLLSVLLEGQPAVVFDNVPDGWSIESAELAKVITSPTYTQRILGINKSATVPTSVIIGFTGNNLRFTTDMATRVLRCNLAADVERPDQRTFRRPDLSTWATAHRWDAIRHGLTVLRGFSVARESGVSVKGRGTRYPSWSVVVRDAVLWAGGIDLAEAFGVLQEEDDLTTAVRLLTEALDTTGPLTPKQIVEKAKSVSETFDDIPEDAVEHKFARIVEIIGKSTPEAVGHWLRGKALGRTHNRKKISKVIDASTKSTMWCAVSLS